MGISNLLLAMAAALAAQQPTVSTTFGEAGGWTVQRRPDGCFMMRGYEGSGNPTLALFVNVNDLSQLVIFHNDSWRLRDGQETGYRLDFAGAAAGNWADLRVVTAPSDGGATISVGFDETTLETLLGNFVEGSSVSLSNGTGLIQRLSLAGGSQGFDVMMRCLQSFGGSRMNAAPSASR